MARRVLLAVNVHARRGRDAKAAMLAALQARGHSVREVPEDTPAEAMSAAIGAQRDRIDVVVVGGGDGTLLHAIDGVIAAKLPLIVLPLGTFNEFARTIGTPDDIDAVADLVENSVPLSVDVGVVNGVRYLNEASIGLSTSVTELQTEDVKSRLGMLAIPVTTLRALRWMRPLKLIVEADDGSTRNVRAVQLTVANSYRFGGVVDNPEASLEDGRLWLYAIDVRGFFNILRVLAAVVLHRFEHAPEVTAVRGRGFTVRSRTGSKHGVYADSEHVTDLPATFSIEPRALTVLVPERSVQAIR
jgi:YegS/Rv2252/BmrU family lipid kinase